MLSAPVGGDTPGGAGPAGSGVHRLQRGLHRRPRADRRGRAPGHGPGPARAVRDAGRRGPHGVRREGAGRGPALGGGPAGRPGAPGGSLVRGPRRARGGAGRPGGTAVADPARLGPGRDPAPGEQQPRPDGAGAADDRPRDDLDGEAPARAQLATRPTAAHRGLAAHPVPREPSGCSAPARRAAAGRERTAPTSSRPSACRCMVAFGAQRGRVATRDPAPDGLPARRRSRGVRGRRRTHRLPSVPRRRRRH